MFFNQQKNAVLALIAKRFCMPLLLVLFFVSSCSDQGCIDADDFGEYETQTLEISSNNSADNCTYDLSKSMTDASQGSGLKTCFISGSVTIYDENGTSQSSTTGCMGLGTEKFKNLCANQCVANCNANIGTASGGSPEPAWNSTGEKNGDVNGGVTVKPNALIYIRAIGSVRLGDKLPFPDFFVSPDDAMPQSKTANWTTQSLDVKAGKTINLSFSGKFTDSSPVNGGATNVGQVGAGSASALDSKVYNASRRLAVYIISAPSGYNYDAAQPTEKARYVNVPLLPDPNLWQCTYSGAETNQSTCNNKSYHDNGYSSVDDTLTVSTFPFTSDTQSTVLGQYGGAIRWQDDAVKPDSYDPFVANGVSCENPACTASNIDPSEGAIVGDLSSRDYSITSQVSAKVSLKFLLGGVNTFCDDNLQIIIRDARDRDVYYFDGVHSGSAAVAVNAANWSSVHIPIEAGQKLVIKSKLLNSYLGMDGSSATCDRALAIRFGRYKDIPITQSGMVSFATLGGLTNAGCNIKARIINPSGRRSNTSAAITADYYEYADFNNAGDPLANLAVPSLTQNVVWTDGASIDNGSAKVFVRKGQIIRFSPESWNGTWNAVGGTRECGIGMAMRIEPRPALLCRGYNVTNVPNPTCIQSYNTTTGVLIGCSEIASECTDQTNATYYCPNQDARSGCLKPLTCTDGVDGGLPSNVPPIPPNTRYNCSLGTRPSGCSIPTGTGATYTSLMCDACSNLRKSRAEQSPFQAMSNIAQCYDLENYTGKVANIPIDGSSASDAISRGAVILSSFNSDSGYGNFSNFASGNQVDRTYNNNIIFQVAQPISVSKTGRMKFLLLDGSDFNQNFLSNYSDNAPGAGANYNGSNGFKISLSSGLEFVNGEWLEAKLCEELATNTMSCKSLTIDPSATANLAGQPKIVELNNPGAGSFTPVSNTPFYFDTSGNLIRSQAAGGSDCIGVLVNDTYYCHTNATVNAQKIRITFKIKDPESATCDMADPTNVAPTTPNGVLMSNTRFRPSDCVVGNPTPDAATPKNGITVADASGNSVCQLNSSAGQTCIASDDIGTNADGSKKFCTKEFRCVSKYANNSGKYYVTVKVKNVGSNLSNIVNDVITPVVEVMDGSRDGTTMGQAERIYRLIISDFRYQAILSTCLVVMITFYGFGYLIGVTEMNSSDLIHKVIKIGLIYLFVGPEGWEWFNKIVVKFFKDGTDYLAFLMASSFDQSPELMNAVQNNDFYDKSVLFSSVDKVFGIFFSSTVQKKISALLFASIFGWAYLLLIYYGMLLYIYAVANSVLLYLTSQVFISILFILGPLFFVFTLFSQTKEMFDKWLSQLISFSLQQIFLLTTLAFFNMMMYEVIKMVLGYKVCWDEVWTINIITRITLMSFWTIASLPPRVNSQSDAGNIGNPDGIPSFFTILFIWVIADLMLKFVDFMTNLAASISGGLKASDLGSGIKAAAGSMKGFVGARAGEIWGKTGGEAVRQLDKFLFDSGSRAEEARAAKKQQNSKDAANKKAMANAGDKAISEFKKANGEKLAGMSKEDQKKTLDAEKNKAMLAEGKKRGLSEDEVERLKKDKGFKYVGENVFGGVAAAAKQAMTRGGSLRTSLNEEKTNTKFSAKEAKAALKNTDEEGRAKIVDAAKKGDIQVGKSGWEGFKSKAGKVATLGIPSAAKAISKAIKDEKDYDEARDQLIAEGVVPKMAAGTYSALPSELKQKIRERRDVNRKQRGEDKGKQSSANTVAKLDIEADILNELESKGDGDFVREDGKLAAVIGRRPIVADVMKRGERANKIRQERSAMNKTEVKAKWDQAEANLDKAQEEYEKFDGDIKATMNDPEFNEKTKRSSELRAKIADPKLSRDERSKARQELSGLKGDKKFQDQTKKLKQDLVARNQAFNAKQNYRAAADNFRDQYNALEEKGKDGPKVNLTGGDDDGGDNNGGSTSDDSGGSPPPPPPPPSEPEIPEDAFVAPSGTDSFSKAAKDDDAMLF